MTDWECGVNVGIRETEDKISGQFLQLHAHRVVELLY